MAQRTNKLATPTSMYLVTVTGPSLDPIELTPRVDRPQGMTIGRHETCDLKLPADAECISRFHARFRFDEPSAQWRAMDLGSSWGTFVNGVKLKPHVELPIAHDDQLRMEPWTFTVAKELRRRALMSSDDFQESTVRTISGSTGTPQAMRGDLLGLLLAAAAGIHRASTEAELAKQVLDAAVRGSGLTNAAIIRLVDANGQIELLASRTPPGSADRGAFTFSRSLLAAAGDGRVAELSAVGDQSHSIVALGIAAALCVPLMIGSSPAAYLYLDTRAMRLDQSAYRAMMPDAVAFCSALGTLAGLALANLKRMDIERRQAAIEFDLNAAAAAQRWLLPQRKIQIPPFTIMGLSRPGQYVGGDFFDVLDLGESRMAVALGDVSGKGVDASVLMTATQGFLHATLLEHRDLAESIASINRFVMPRRPSNRFVTLWVGVFDSVAGTVTYVDAGHGHAAMVSPDRKIQNLDQGGGPPLGVMADFNYKTEIVSLSTGSRVLVVSDGIVEQPAMTPGSEAREDFTLNGAARCLFCSSGDDIGEIFSCLLKHAGTDQLADDATAVCVSW